MTAAGCVHDGDEEDCDDDDADQTHKQSNRDLREVMSSSVSPPSPARKKRSP